MIPTLRSALLAVGLCAAPGEQDPRIAALVKKLEAEDWVEQAQAAKDLA
jgi:hypothetical protein